MGSPQTSGVRLRQLDVNRVARKGAEAGLLELGGADHVLDRAAADRHIGRAAGLMPARTGVGHRIRVRSARVPEPLLLGVAAAPARDVEVLAALGRKRLELLE